jgi:hypothetical protein
MRSQHSHHSQLSSCWLAASWPAAPAHGATHTQGSCRPCRHTAALNHARRSETVPYLLRIARRACHVLSGVARAHAAAGARLIRASHHLTCWLHTAQRAAPQPGDVRLRTAAGERAAS